MCAFAYTCNNGREECVFAYTCNNGRRSVFLHTPAMMGGMSVCLQLQ